MHLSNLVKFCICYVEEIKNDSNVPEPFICKKYTY